MNKMKKLLSVVLAIVLALSCMSVAASAAKTAYKEVTDLEALDAYSPYGQVTRLSLEERTSIILDFLDSVLPGLNINMGEVFNVLGLSVTIDLRSVDRLCYSFDTIKDTFTSTLASIAMGIVDLGILESLTFGSNNELWTTGMTRDGTAQFTILSELLEFLSGNTTLVGKVFSDGLDLGLVSLGDTSSIEKIIMNLPGMIKGLIYPMIERWDDTLADVQRYDNSIAGTGDNVEAIINTRVQKLFTDNMSITTVKYDANGNMTSEHTGMPITVSTSDPAAPSATSPRCVYYVTGTTPGSVMTVYHIVDNAESEALAKDADGSNDKAAYTYFKEEQTYVLEEEVAGSGVYVWRATDDFGNKWSMKWYNDESPLLPGAPSFNLSEGGDSAAALLYKFVPVVFENMAPVVLNGSLKKILAGFLGAKFEKVGYAVENEAGTACTLDDEAAAAIPVADQSNAFFTQVQGEYLWEWSDYAIISGNHYWRFEDEIWMADITETNNYFDIINWEYEITDDFMNEFVPENGGSTSDTLLMNLNDFLIKVATTIVKDSAETTDEVSGYTATWTCPDFTAGGNDNLVANIKAAAQAVVALAPQHIFGEDWETDEFSYVKLMLANTTQTGKDAENNVVTVAGVTVPTAIENDTILTGIAAELVTLIMPSMKLPKADDLLIKDESDNVTNVARVGAILAAVVREFAAYLAPEYNFDALIYADFGTTTDDNVKSFVDPEAAGLLTAGSTVSGYWFDVILTMGINVGYEYLRAFADLGEDTELCAGVVNAPVNYMADGGTYAAGTTQATLNAQWEGMVDYIIDWALEADYEWCWGFENVVDTEGLTIDLTTAQDPWVKLNKIFFDLLPIDEILNITATDCETKLEQALRYNLILAIVDLRWGDLADMLIVPDGALRNANILDQLAAKLKNIVNYIFKTLGGGSYELLPAAMTDLDTLANQDNIVTLVKGLVGVLYTGLVTNGGCRTFFPLLNFFLGWKTDPQKIADPVMGYQFKANKDYAFQGTTDAEAGGSAGKGDSASTGTAISGTYITFLNNSAGMLETHRNSTTVDHAYDINIVDVTFDATTNTGLSASYVTVADDGTETAADNVVEPYEKVWVKVNGTYKGDEAVTMTVAYDYVGKDGNAVGGTQYTSYTFLISGLYEDADRIGTQANDHDNDYTGIYDFKSYVFTEELYKSVTEYEQGIHYVQASLSNPDKSFAYCYSEGSTVDCNGNKTADGDLPTEPASNYFAQYEGQAGGWAGSVTKDSSSTSAKLYYAKDGVTENTEFAYGAYDMGGVAVKYGDDTKVWYVDFIHYNDYGIDQIYADNKDNGYNAHQGVDSATYEAYRTAWNKIVYLATYPMMTTARNIADWNGKTATGTSANDYVTAIMPQIEPAIAAFETAKKDYETALADAQASGAGASLPEYVTNLATEIENDFANGKEINFQDYNFYEYFNYNDVKVAGENMYRTFLAPKVLDTYYIEGSGICEDELDYVIANAKANNAIIGAGIEASREMNEQADIDASQAAHDEWKMPVTSKLIVDDLTARLAYYKTFLVEANMENTLSENPDHLYFLNQEIAHIEAQQLNEADYTEASWAEYAEALADAKAVADGSDEFAAFNSRVYDVKWNLMVAYKNLLTKELSLIENGGTAILQTNVETANAIFASLAAGDGVWAVKEGVDANTAYAELIKALGYNYQAVYSENDNEVQNGEVAAGTLKWLDEEKTVPMMFNLYADSALEYLENDRPDRQSNQAKVDKANAALELAIANFEEAVTEVEAPELGVIDGTTGAFGETTTDEETGVVSGYIYGVTAGDTAANYFELVDAEAGTVEWTVGTASVTNGTGAVATVKDTNGDTVAVYTLVIFGDVNGDAAITAADSDSISIAALGGTIEGEANNYAADVNGDTSITAADSDTTSIAALGGAITVNPHIG